MLRFILIALVVANIGYFVVSRGEASGPGEREPQRLAQQIRPELLQIRKSQAVVVQPDAPTPPPTPATPVPPSALPAESAPMRADGDSSR